MYVLRQSHMANDLTRPTPACMTRISTGSNVVSKSNRLRSWLRFRNDEISLNLSLSLNLQELAVVFNVQPVSQDVQNGCPARRQQVKRLGVLSTVC